MDRRFVTKVADDGKAEVELAQLAAQRATNPEVKSFAEKLVKDHTAVNSELTSLAGQKAVKLDNDDGRDRAYRRLSSKSGAEFDEEFVEHMIDEHEKDIKMFEKASQDAKDQDLRSFASKHVGHLREHLQQAQGLRSSISPTGRESTTSRRADASGAASSPLSTTTPSSSSDLNSKSSGSDRSGTYGTPSPSSASGSTSSSSSDTSKTSTTK